LAFNNEHNENNHQPYESILKLPDISNCEYGLILTQFSHTFNHFSNSDLSFSWLDSPRGPRPPLWGSSITLKTNHNRQDSSEWVIYPSQRPLRDNTQHS